jgi:hypothetical protein
MRFRVADATIFISADYDAYRMAIVEGSLHALGIFPGFFLVFLVIDNGEGKN